MLKLAASSSIYDSARRRASKDDHEVRIRELLREIRDARWLELERLRHELRRMVAEELGRGGNNLRPRATGTTGRQAVCLAFLEASWKYPPMTAPANRLTNRMLPRLGSATTVAAFESQMAV